MSSPNPNLVINNVSNAVLNGLKGAFDEYLAISGEYIRGNEHFMSCAIAKSVATKFKNRTNTWVTLEQSKNAIAEYVGAPRGRPAKTLAGSPRHDAMVWDGTNPWCVIEVKSFPQSRVRERQRHDVQRIKALIRSSNYPSLKHGIFAFFSIYQNESKHESNRSQMVERFREGDFAVSADFCRIPVADREFNSSIEAVAMALKFLPFKG